MAFIYEFTIHGLAGRTKPLRHVLDRHVNIFWGLNGSGKTSLLKILHSALRNDTTILARVPFDRAEVIFHSAAHEAVIRRSITMDSLNRETLFDHEVAFELDPAPYWSQTKRATSQTWDTKIVSPSFTFRYDREVDLSEPFRHTYLPISRVSQSRTPEYPGIDNPRKRAVNDALLDEMFATQVKRKWQIYTAESLSEIRKIQQQGLASILAVLFGGALNERSTAPPAEDADAAYMLVQNFLNVQGISLKFGRAKFVERYESDHDLQRVVANIKEVTKDVAETLRPQREFQSVIEHFYSGNKRLIFGDTSSSHRGTSLKVEVRGESIPLESLSSGEKQLLQLLLETLATDSSAVLIDEPELSMHVDWQLGLVASMQRLNPECQLILATHSPEVMADVPDQYVFQL